MDAAAQTQTSSSSSIRPHLENAEMRQEILDAAHPERRKGAGKDKSTLRSIFGRGNDWYRYKCERRVEEAVKAPSVKLLIGALKSAGCDFDISRHIACEYCDERISGGYDADSQQIIICQNQATMKGIAVSTLTHEMLHMFDYCRFNMNFRNVYHVACSEIRAAALTHCSFINSWMTGDSPSPLNYTDTHRNCVRNKAVTSVLAVRQITLEEAEHAVDSVFLKCYNDLEPFGRVPRRNSRDCDKSYFERYYYGYVGWDDSVNPSTKSSTLSYSNSAVGRKSQQPKNTVPEVRLCTAALNTDVEVNGQWPDIRLVDGSSASEGRVEIKRYVDRDGQWYNHWGTVCSNHWNVQNAQVVCRMLGYEPAAAAETGPHLRFRTGHGFIAMSQVHCNGYEFSLYECQYSRSINGCRHDDDVNVRCLGARAYVPERLRGLANDSRTMQTQITALQQALSTMRSEITEWSKFWAVVGAATIAGTVALCGLVIIQLLRRVLRNQRRQQKILVSSANSLITAYPTDSWPPSSMVRNKHLRLLPTSSSSPNTSAQGRPSYRRQLHSLESNAAAAPGNHTALHFSSNTTKSSRKDVMSTSASCSGRDAERPLSGISSNSFSNNFYEIPSSPPTTLQRQTTTVL